MKKDLTRKEIIEVASMLFGLFFGAGNLIFPIYMGQMSGYNVFFAIIGFLITGVGLPLLGVTALGKSKSTGLYDLTSKIGKPYAMFFTCLLYLTIGPFFAIPRCATTSFTIGIEQALNVNNENLYLLIFTLIFFIITLYFSLRPGKILTWIGKILNPCFLFFLSILLIVALFNPSVSIGNVSPTGNYLNNSFFTGFLEGYNTMDVLASLAFGIIIVEVIQELGIKDSDDIARNTIKSGIFSSILMAIVYILVTIVGVQSRGLFEVSENGGVALALISKHYLGNVGLYIMAITITIACLKTAIGLITSCAKTFSELFPKSFSYKTWTIIFVLVSFIFSNLGLNTIIEYSVPVLMFLYPLAIVLILLSIFFKDRLIYQVTIGFTLIGAFYDLLANLPDNLKLIFNLNSFLNEAETIIPLANYGMGWLIFSIIGLFIGLFIQGIKKKSY